MISVQLIDIVPSLIENTTLTFSTFKMAQKISKRVSNNRKIQNQWLIKQIFVLKLWVNVSAKLQLMARLKLMNSVSCKP